MDVTSENAVDAGVNAVVEEFGALDILVSNAGIQIVSSIVDFAYPDWRKMQAIHVDGAFRQQKPPCDICTRTAVVALSSIWVLVHSHLASPLSQLTSAQKHALLGLSRTLAKEGAAHNVRSHVVCPGFVRTPLVDRQIPEQAKELGLTEDEVIRNVMLGGTVDGNIYDR